MSEQPEYRFTRAQLSKLLFDTIEMLIEWRDHHGHSEESAATGAVHETLDGLDAERELAAAGECRLSMQIGKVQ